MQMLEPSRLEEFELKGLTHVSPGLYRAFNPVNAVGQYVEVCMCLGCHGERLAFAAWIDPDNDPLLLCSARLELQSYAPNTVEPERSGFLLFYPTSRTAGARWHQRFPALSKNGNYRILR